MKIIKDNFKPAPPVYPQNYICQFCASELQIENASDIKKDIPVKQPTAADPAKQVLALGFTCPCCNQKNVTG